MHLRYIAGGFVIIALLTGCGTSAMRTPSTDPGTQPTASTSMRADTTQQQSTGQNAGDRGTRRQTAPPPGTTTPATTSTPEATTPAVPVGAVPATDALPAL